MLTLTVLESKHSLAKSFGFASEGLKAAFLKGRNFRIQIILGILAIIFGIVLRLNSSEWLDLIIVVSFVLILELINTAIEAIIDLVSPSIHEKAKMAKDVAAAAVFLASLTSIAIGAIIFLPKILGLLLPR